MARPIAATPILKGEEAANFIAKIHENAKNKIGVTPTPNLYKAQELIKKHDEHNQKHLR